MTGVRNGQDHQTNRDPARRHRFDDVAAIATRNSPGPGATAATPVDSQGHSGRRFVLVAGVIVLLIWGTIYLFFREWRAKYRERARYGATQVVPALEPLRGAMPPGVDMNLWRDAIDQTRSMLMTVTGSNLLDVADMVELRVELTRHVRLGCKHPAKALGELAEIWNEVADRGDFLFRDSRSQSGDRHPRPRIVPTYGATRIAPAVNPLRVIVPVGVDPVAWRDAIDQTRSLLIAVTDSGLLSVHNMQKLRIYLDKQVGRANDHPETVRAVLAEIWNEVADLGESMLKGGRSDGGDRYPRPQILPPRKQGE
jgi:hypothetical protein